MTTEPGSFSRLLGKRCTENNQDIDQTLLQPVTNPIFYGYIPEEVLKDLISNQRLLFQYCKGIGSGKFADTWRYGVILIFYTYL